MADLASHTKVTEKMSAINKLFMAPECFSVETERITPKADIYSLGVILYLMIAWDLQEEVSIGLKSPGDSAKCQHANLDFSEE